MKCKHKYSNAAGTIRLPWCKRCGKEHPELTLKKQTKLDKQEATFYKRMNKILKGTKL